MKNKIFIQNLDKDDARNIIVSVLDGYFKPLNFHELRCDEKFQDKDNPGQFWANGKIDGDYIEIPIVDCVTGFKTSAVLFDKKIVVLGYEEINADKKIQQNYKKAMYEVFGRKYMSFLKKEEEKELEM